MATQVAPKPDIKDAASRNANVSAERVQRYVQVVKRLQESGLLKESGYRLSHPLNGGRELCKNVAARSLNTES